jgi:hypothetical protein
MKEIKNEMKSRARLLRGLSNVLQLDAEYIWSDANNFDLDCLGESVREAKVTLQQAVDCLTELEYHLYLTKRKESL